MQKLIFMDGKKVFSEEISRVWKNFLSLLSAVAAQHLAIQKCSECPSQWFETATLAGASASKNVAFMIHFIKESENTMVI